MDHLHEYAGRKADWTVLLAYRQDNKVLIYKGSVSGTIVKPRGTTGFGFDPVFLPDGAIETLAESKPDLVNARAKAVEALLQKMFGMSVSCLKNGKARGKKTIIDKRL